MNIQDLKSNTTWQEASNTINNNNNKISLAIATLENARLKNKGYFTTLEKLKEAIPNPTIGSKAYVGTSEPYAIYIVENGVWVDSGYTGGDEIVANITTDRIKDSAVTSEKIATSAFDSTLSVSGKIAPADVVGTKLTELSEEIEDITGTHTSGKLTWTRFGSINYFPYNLVEGKTYTIKCTTNIAFTRLLVFYGGTWGESGTYAIIDGNKTEATFIAKKDYHQISFNVVSGTDLADGVLNFIITYKGKIGDIENKIENINNVIGYSFYEKTQLVSAYAGINYDVDIEEGDTYGFVVNTDNVPLFLIAYPDKSASSYETIKNIKATGTSHIIWTADKHYNRIRLYKGNDTNTFNVECSISKEGLKTDIVKNAADIDTLNSTVSTIDGRVSINENDIQGLKNTVGTPLFSKTKHLTNDYSEITYGKINGNPVIFSNKEYIIEFSNNAVQRGLRFLAYTDSTNYDIIFTNQFGEKQLVFKPTKDYIFLRYQQTVAQEVDASMTILELDNSIIVQLKGKINKGEVGTDDIINGSITNNKLSSNFHFPKVEITDLSEDTIVDIDLSYNIYNHTTVAQGKYINKNTGLPNQNNSKYETSDYIEVEEGQPYYLRQLGSDYSLKSNHARFISFWDADKKKVGDVLEYVVMTGYVIPSGVKYIMITCNSTTFEGGTTRNILLYKGTEEKPFRPYGDNKYNIKENLIKINVANKIEDATIAESKLTLDVQRKLNSIGIIARPNGMTIKGDIADGEQLQLPRNSVKNNKCIAFTAKISNWNANSEIWIGQGYHKYLSSWFVIDNEGARPISYSTAESLGTRKLHNLSIGDNLQVEIKKYYIEKDDGTFQNITELTIVSKGHSFTSTFAGYNGDNGEPFIKAVNCSFTNATLGWYSEALNYDNWLFGDSYFTLSSGDRWPYYLMKNHHYKNLQNAYSGESSETATTDLMNLLEMNTPKRIVWCMGMNDVDTSTAVNARWKTGYDNLVRVCEAKNIDLVLAVLPNVEGGFSDDDTQGNTGFRNHSFKNAIIKESGYRYIDFEQAVGAQANGKWYNDDNMDFMLERLFSVGANVGGAYTWDERTTDTYTEVGEGNGAFKREEGTTHYYFFGEGNGNYNKDGLVFVGEGNGTHSVKITRVHPTSRGAISLYNQAVADCPELMTIGQ